MTHSPHQPKLAYGHTQNRPGERVFVIAPLAANPRPANAHRYGGIASGATYVESDPIGLAGGSYSTYAYTAGNPVNNVDPQGTLLQVAYSNGGTEAQLSIALAYLAGSSQYIGDLAQLIASPYLYTLNVDPNGTDSYAYQNRTITWNPTSGLNITGVGIQSPAIALAHETHHAECHQSLGTKAFRASQRVPSQTVINDDGITVLLGISADERNATLAEQIVSQQLGGQDPGRTSYHQPTTPITVSSPIYHSLYGGP